MPTKAERTAVMFLAAVVVTGSLVRLVGASRRGVKPPPAALAALAAQRMRADSLANAGPPGRDASPRAPRRAPRPRADAPISSSLPERTASQRAPVERPPIDVDRATAAELERLPRIGPALAARIVAERDARGAFGSLDSLEKRVRGIGPALSRTISALVTFSGR